MWRSVAGAVASGALFGVWGAWHAVSVVLFWALIFKPFRRGKLANALFSGADESAWEGLACASFLHLSGEPSVTVYGFRVPSITLSFTLLLLLVGCFVTAERADRRVYMRKMQLFLKLPGVHAALLLSVLFAPVASLILQRLL